MKVIPCCKWVILVLVILSNFNSTFAGNVIFVHVDGVGVANWQALRFLTVGPDGHIEWDKLPHIAVYRGHI